MNTNPKRLLAVLTIFILAFAANPALAQPPFAFAKHYEVSITNLTEAQAFTPFIVATHMPSIRLFTPGEEASQALATLAESGATGPLEDLLSDFPDEVHDVVTTEGLLMPGQTVTVQIGGDGRRGHLSLAGMLIPTNDTFVGVNGMPLPAQGNPMQGNSTLVPAYDAGSEPNDELCANIPGPVCGGEGASPGAGGEGYVFISQGIQGIGDLEPELYDWRNPVARVEIQRITSP